MSKKKIYKIKITNGRDWYQNKVGEEFTFVVDSPTRKNHFVIIFSSTNAMHILKNDCEVIEEKYGDTKDELSITKIGMDLNQKPTCQ